MGDLIQPLNKLVRILLGSSTKRRIITPREYTEEVQDYIRELTRSRLDVSFRDYKVNAAIQYFITPEQNHDYLIIGTVFPEGEKIQIVKSLDGFSVDDFLRDGRNYINRMKLQKKYKSIQVR